MVWVFWVRVELFGFIVRWEFVGLLFGCISFACVLGLWVLVLVLISTWPVWYLFRLCVLGYVLGCSVCLRFWVCANLVGWVW